MAETGKAKTVIFTVLVPIITIIIALLLIEGVLRLKNSNMKNYDIEMWKYSKALKHRSDNQVLGHEHNTSTSAFLQNVEIRINERGLRGGPVSAPGTYDRRILFLGSSITLGWGVPEEETMTARLEKMFREDGQKVEVLNGGIGNYNTVRYVERFLTRLEDLKPTDIVVHYFVNDAEKLDAGGGNALLRNSQLAATVWGLIKTQMAVMKGGSLEDHYKAVYDTEAEGYREMKAALKRLSEYARKNNIRVFLAMTADVHNLTDYPFTYIHEDLETIANTYRYTYIDLYPAFEGLTPEKVWSMPGDPHPNGLGHKLMADAIYPALAKAKGVR